VRRLSTTKEALRLHRVLSAPFRSWPA
jgi:hypothetical protein